MIKKIFVLIILLAWCSVANAVQFARPDLDVTLNTWTDDAGGTTTIYDNINDVVADDADYVKIVAADELLTVRLSDVTDPEIHTGHIVRFRMYGTGAGPPERLNVRLFQAGTQIAESGTLTSDGVWGDKSYTLTEGEAAAITDYTNLFFRCNSSQNTGGADEIRCSWAELEVPDVSASFTPQVRWWQ